MLKRYESEQITEFLQASALLCAMLLAYGCGTTVVQPVGPGGDGAPDDRDVGAAPAPAPGPGPGVGDPQDDLPQDPPAPPPPNPGAGDPCDASALAAKAFMEDYCASCHGNGAAQGGFGATLDVDAMIAAGKLTPGDPSTSNVYTRTANDTMPPVGVSPRPSTAELASVEEWILCGAPDWDTVGVPGGNPPAVPNAYITLNEKLDLIYRDLRSILNPADRELVRYIDLSTVSNAGVSESQLEVYREAISFQINSLSTGIQIVVPEPIDPARTIFRIELDDYGLTPEKWNLIEAEYPFAVNYDDDSFLYDIDQFTLELIREETETLIPFVQADWFLFTAAEAPLYYDLLDFPNNLDQLFVQLGLDRQGEVDDLRVIRVGIESSGVALFRNRLTQRYDLINGGGYLWESFDFLENVGQSNIFEFPLDFVPVGGEVIHSLPNGMQAYSIWEGDGTRIDEAPTILVVNPSQPNGVVSPKECVVCHGVGGIIPQTDKLRDYTLANVPGGQDKETVLALHPPQSVVDNIQSRDTEIFRSSIARAGVSQDIASGMNSVYRRFEQGVTLARAAAILEIPEEQLKQALDADPAAFPQAVSVLRNNNGSVQLDAFFEVFADVVEALGLGDPFTVNNNVL